MKEITIIAKNEVGALAQVAEALGNVGVNIESIAAYGKDGEAVFRVITTDATTTSKVVSKVPAVKKVLEAGVIVVKMMNRPGELGKITRKLSNKGINLESLYIVSRKPDYTEVAVKPIDAQFNATKELLNVK